MPKSKVNLILSFVNKCGKMLNFVNICTNFAVFLVNFTIFYHIYTKKQVNLAYFVK